MSNELLIKINADAQNAIKAFDDIRDKTSDLEDKMDRAALVSAAAFAALTAEVYLADKAFREAQVSSIKLTNALQNQGIYTAELQKNYEDIAKAIEAKTGVDGDAIVAAQALAQSYLHQTEITPELTAAIVDLSATMGGDLNGAAEKVARTIGTGTNAFRRQGLQIDESATTAERYAKVLEFVQQKAGGMAEEFNKADGYSKALANAFGNLQESIGARFAPVLAAARKILGEFFQMLSENEIVGDLAASLLTAGVVVSGLIAAITAAVPVFLALSAAATALGVSLSIAFVGIPLAIAAVVAGLTFLALNWGTAVAFIKAAVNGMVTFVTEMFSGLGTLLTAAFTLNPTKIKAALDVITNAYKKAKDDTVKTYQEVTASQKEELEKQDTNKKAAADKEAAKEKEKQDRLKQIQAAGLAVLKLQNENGSQAQIDLKQKEIETLKALNEDKSAQEIALLKERLQIIRDLEAEQQAEDLERLAIFEQLKLDTAAQIKNQGIEVDAEIRDKRLAELQATAKTEEDIDRQLQENILQTRIDANNKKLLDQKKYGEAVAIINKALGSEEVKGAKDAAGELVQLQQSKNENLKAIGKAAAITQITISTAESAMKIYQGFAAIPIVGPALGVAGAAAAVAFGAERIGQVTAAADGGLIEGGVQGKDSVPALLMPGELVVPKQNFNQVVGAVQGEGQGQDPEILKTLQEINAKFSAPQTTILQGDVLSDDSFIDALVRKISDAIEFRNAKIVGVNI